MEPKKSICVKIPKSLYDRVVEFANANGETKSFVVRQALLRYLGIIKEGKNAK